MQGNVGHVPKDLTGHQFKGCNSHGRSLQAQGSIAPNTVTQILDTMPGPKDEGEVDKNAAGASKTMESASITPRTSEG